MVALECSRIWFAGEVFALKVVYRRVVVFAVDPVAVFVLAATGTDKADLQISRFEWTSVNQWL